MTRNSLHMVLGLLVTASTCLIAENAVAGIDGVEQQSFHLTAESGYLSTPDGNTIYFWGYAVEGTTAQYPGPTLIVEEDQPVSITLTNTLTVPVSIVLPGQVGVTASGGSPGLLGQEAAPGQTITYTFTPTEPGTYLYNSGSNPDLQVEMGLFGALLVKPAAGAGLAYNDPATGFTDEYLFLLSEIDPSIHEAVEFGTTPGGAETRDYFPTYWFINGRASPDTMAPAFASWLPSQPYSAMPMMRPGDRLLLRLIGAGRDPHPFHTHGNNMFVFARDGRLLKSDPSIAGLNLAVSNYTHTVAPGQTADAFFEWTGADLGWDIYGHSPGDMMEPNEDPDDHGKQIPVAIPDDGQVTNGSMYSGTPFLGASASLPPGQGTGNQGGDYFFMWHSHTEREMTNFDVFPGGLMTMLVVMPHM